MRQRLDGQSWRLWLERNLLVAQSRQWWGDEDLMNRGAQYVASTLTEVNDHFSKVEVRGPQEITLTSRRGKIQAMNPRAGAQVITAQVPLAEMFGYATDLRSKTQGRATYTMQFGHYAQVPNNIAETIVTKAKGAAAASK